MNRKLTAIAVGTVSVVLLIALVYWGFSREDTGDGTEFAEAVDSGPLTEAGEAILFFPGRGGRLYPELRSLPSEQTGEDRLRLIVDELLRGPTDTDLSPTLPSHVGLADLTLDATGTLYINLSSKEAALRGLGSTSEMLAVYSLVDTALLNEPDARSVVLLWNGRQRTSLAGHVDTGRPLTVNRRLIAASS